MKKVLYLFLLLPFLWQCDALDNFFEPANLEGGVVEPQDTLKSWSIHSNFDVDDLSEDQNITTSYTSPIPKTYLTDDGYVFYGKIADNRDDIGGRSIWILLEIREVGGEIKINSAYTTNSNIGAVTPLELYNARTELPTTVLKGAVTDTIKSIGLWPKYSRLTHENLATTNTSQFNYVSALQAPLYTNILPEKYSLLTGTSGIGNEILSIAGLEAIVSGKTWNAVNYPGYGPVSNPATNYYFFADFTLHASTSVITGTPTLSPYYGWDIWTFYGFTAAGVVTEHYLYTYRSPTLFLLENAGGTSSVPGEQRDLLRFAARVAPVSPNEVYANLIRLSIAP